MKVDDYQDQAASFATGGGKTLVYSALGLFEEVGEMIDKLEFTVDPENPEQEGLAHLLRDIASHARFVGTIAKDIRKNFDKFDDDKKNFLLSLTAKGGDFTATGKEIGDCLWMLANTCENLGLYLEEEMETNIVKLTDRLNRGVIVGEGDNR